MQTIKLCDFGKSLGTRALAREIRNTILQHFSEPVVLDFSEVEIVNNAFVDELIGTYIRIFGFSSFKKNYKFSNTNKNIKAVIVNTIKQSI